MPIERCHVRFCVTARICRPKAVQPQSLRSDPEDGEAKTTIHEAVVGDGQPPISNAPDIQAGLSTTLLVGPKIVRTACCRISDRPQVASSVSSGRP